MTLQERHYRAIAMLLCDATEAILWRQAQPWLETQTGSHQLHCRVGSGEATYYKQSRQDVHVLTYGRKMVASKHDAAIAAQWRTGREILKRGYFAAELTLPSLLAHTCCHEFGHVIQSINGWINRGSIHNRQFYAIVDRIHNSGMADSVRDYLEARAAEQGLPLQFSDVSRPTAAVASFRPGELVSFEYRGRPVVGKVLRVNRKTVNVKPVMPPLAADYFRVSPGFLKPHH